MIKFQFRSKTAEKDFAYKDKNPEYLKLQEFVSTQIEKAPFGMKSLFQTSYNWPDMQMEIIWVQSAKQGILMSIIFAAIVILIATRNIIQTLISILCVTFIIISVMAIINLQGWEFGVAESLGVVCLIGLSVDYVVHLSTEY